ncbi:hypothetical protein ON010_g906 [Phytophthora cinnamomi]|nr:hypothetical protein ON010_g906 [Phytophthora cinnamomi]
MAIVHDLAESLVGDITPHDGEWVSALVRTGEGVGFVVDEGCVLCWHWLTLGVAEEDKHRMEKVREGGLFREALDEICSTLGDTPSAAEIRALWNEYEAGSTEEAKIVKVCQPRQLCLPPSVAFANVLCAPAPWLFTAALQDFDKFEMILQADDYERADGLLAVLALSAGIVLATSDYGQDCDGYAVLVRCTNLRSSYIFVILSAVPLIGSVLLTFVESDDLRVAEMEECRDRAGSYRMVAATPGSSTLSPIDNRYIVTA